MKKQIVIIADMEGASGIFDGNRDAVIHGSSLWREYGKKCITSDVLAVCQAANECEIDEILIYDEHFAGEPEYNIIIDELPENIKLFNTWNRCFDWRRIRGQADLELFGLITVGQHARYGEPNAYFPHTIQSPPIKALMEVFDNYRFKEPEKISWKGAFFEKEAIWESPSVEIGFEIFNYVRNCITGASKSQPNF
jgi:D-aminopeptidase